MKKIDGIDNVRVSLKDGLTILDLKPGNTRSTPASVASTSAMRGSVS